MGEKKSQEDMVAKRSLLAAILVAGMILSAGVAKADLSVVKSKFDVTFYGYIKAEAAYNSARAYGENWIVFAYPDKEPYIKENTLVFTMRQTRFGFNIAAPGPTETSKVLGNIEIDLYGAATQQENKVALHLRRAFVMLKYPKWSILAGNEWMLISPLLPHVSNYPAQQGLGNLGYRMPQFRFTYGDVWRAAISVGEKLEDDTTMGSFSAGSKSAVPDTQLQLGYWGKNNLQVILSGHYAEEKYFEPNAGNPDDYHNFTVPSYSYNLSLNIPFGKKLALDGEFYYGANLDGWYCGDVFQMGVGIDDDGDKVPVRDIGGWIELMVKPVNKWTVYVGYGEDNPKDSDIAGGIYTTKMSSTIWDDKKLGTFMGFTRNSAYFAHIMYDVTDAFRISFEEQYVRTEYKDEKVNGEDGQVWRSDLAFWFFF